MSNDRQEREGNWENEGGAVDPEPEPKQKTLRGYEIPVPTRKQVFDALRKVAKPKPKNESHNS
jgi:hypothetical protein